MAEQRGCPAFLRGKDHYAMECSLTSLYLCVRDMPRAIAFYETLLERGVTSRDEIYSVFEINGFRLGLFAYEKMGEAHTFGSNCLPSLGVGSLAVLTAKLKGQELCFPLTKIGGNWVAEIVDPEGNHIEMTAPAAP